MNARLSGPPETLLQRLRDSPSQDDLRVRSVSSQVTQMCLDNCVIAHVSKWAIPGDDAHPRYRRNVDEDLGGRSKPADMLVDEIDGEHVIAGRFRGMYPQGNPNRGARWDRRR